MGLRDDNTNSKNRKRKFTSRGERERERRNVGEEKLTGKWLIDTTPICIWSHVFFSYLIIQSPTTFVLHFGLQAYLRAFLLVGFLKCQSYFMLMIISQSPSHSTSPLLVFDHIPVISENGLSSALCSVSLHTFHNAILPFSATNWLASSVLIRLESSPTLAYRLCRFSICQIEFFLSNYG